jgi:uncharacterized protein YcbK (DUF882 family)
MSEKNPVAIATSGNITENFWWHEARCNHCGGLPDNLESIIKTARFMEEVREYLGNQPMKVNSWYRCPEWNTTVGGASDSYHMKGQAVDFTIKTMTPRQVQAKLRKIWGASGIVKGLGAYKGFTHVDRRAGTPAKWNG